MKRFALFVLAAIMGSALTYATIKLFEDHSAPAAAYAQIQGSPVVGATYTVNEHGEVVPLEFTGVAKQVMPAVVHIKSTKMQRANPYGGRMPESQRDMFGNDLFHYFFGPQQQQSPHPRVGTGSGVIISADGYIVTNNHVISEADEIEVTLDDNQVYKAKVIGTDPSTDLALLQIKAKDLPYIPLLNSDEIEVGEWVLAVGNPFNLNSTVTAGIVSAKGRNINILRDKSAIESFIQTDAAINPGNSGGALVNLQGGLVGINTAIASPTGTYAGYGFAIPANIVAKVIGDLREYGMVQRGYLGIMIRSVDARLAEQKDLDVTEGVYVDSLMAESAAAEAGLKTGDVILNVDDHEVKSSAELQEIIGRKHPGDKVMLTIDRKGQEKNYEVILKNRDGETEMRSRENMDVINILGAELEELDEKTARKLGIEGGLRVKTLRNGKLKNETKIEKGFIITHIDKKTITTEKELRKYLEGKEGGVMLEGIYEDYPGTYYYAFGL